MNRFVVFSLLCFLSSLLVGCGGGSDVTTVSPEDQKMLDSSHEQAAKSMGAIEAGGGNVTNPGGHAQ